MKKRRKNNSHLTSNRNNSNNNGGGESEETRQAVVLIVIVLLFLVCNVPRIVLNFFEVLTAASFKENMGNKCFRLPLWVEIMTSVSLILITFNSSVNFFIYCFFNTTFRRELFAMLKKCLCTVKNANNNNGMAMSQTDKNVTSGPNKNQEK